MSLSFVLYNRVKQFDDIRRENRKKYLDTVKGLEAYKGSEGYKKEIEKAEKVRREADETAKREAMAEIDRAFSDMLSASEEVKTKAPSNEAINLLTALQMRKSVTREELDTIANSLDGNPVALRALADISTDFFKKGALKGHPGNYGEMVSEMDKSEITANIGRLRRYVNGVLNSPLTEGAKVAEDYYSRHGKAIDSDDLKQRGEYTHERQFYLEALGNQADKFTDAINGGGNEKING